MNSWSRKTSSRFVYPEKICSKLSRSEVDRVFGRGYHGVCLVTSFAARLPSVIVWHYAWTPCRRFKFSLPSSFVGLARLYASTCFLRIKNAPIWRRTNFLFCTSGEASTPASPNVALTMENRQVALYTWASFFDRENLSRKTCSSVRGCTTNWACNELRSETNEPISRFSFEVHRHVKLVTSNFAKRSYSLQRRLFQSPGEFIAGVLLRSVYNATNLARIFLFMDGVLFSIHFTSLDGMTSSVIRDRLPTSGCIRHRLESPADRRSWFIHWNRVINQLPSVRRTVIQKSDLFTL